MDRPKFTPRKWNSEDGRWTYVMSENGFTDILPGPKSRLMEWIYKNYPEHKNLNAPKPYKFDSHHDHWAM